MCYRVVVAVVDVDAVAVVEIDFAAGEKNVFVAVVDVDVMLVLLL